MSFIRVVKKQPDPCNTKEHYQSFIRKKTKQSIKQAKVECFENSNIVDIKPVNAKHPKTLHELSKSNRQTEKFS